MPDASHSQMCSEGWLNGIAAGTQNPAKGWTWKEQYRCRGDKSTWKHGRGGGGTGVEEGVTGQRLLIVPPTQSSLPLPPAPGSRTLDPATGMN